MHAERRFPIPVAALVARPRRRGRLRHERRPGHARVPGKPRVRPLHRGARPELAELDCDVRQHQRVRVSPGEEDASAAAASAALASETSVPHPELSVGRRESDGEADGDDGATGAFLDRLPRSRVVTVGNVTVGLVGVCTTSTPLSSARKPRGVVFAEAVPTAREHARRVAPLCDAVVALTHQTLPEDARLAEEVPEIAVILGGHEHTPFAGRMGHGANAAAANGPIGADTECVNHLAGTLCVKAGMDAENVVVVVVEAPGADPSSTIGADRGGECTEEAAAARGFGGSFGGGGERQGRFRRGRFVEEQRRRGPRVGAGGTDVDDGDDDGRPTYVPRPDALADQRRVEPRARARPPRRLRIRRAGRRDWHRGEGSPAGLRRRRLGADVLAQGVQDGPGNRRGHLATQRGAQGAESAHAQPPRARGEAGFDAVIVQGRARGGQCSLGTLFATILRDECRADVCLYNSGGIRGNVAYGGEP